MVKKRLFLIVIFFLVATVGADQVLWDNDSDIIIYDTWKDIDGTPLTGADCSWIVYNSDRTINQSGIPSEFSLGIINFTVTRLSIFNTYPLLINCSKGGFNGTSSLREIKIIDELLEDVTPRLDELNTTIQTIETLSEEINITTHQTLDMLIDDINITLTTILSTTNLSHEQITNISSNLNSLLDDEEEVLDFLREKWDDKDAKEIINKIKDLKDEVEILVFRFEYLPESQLSSMLLSIRQDSGKVLDILQGDDETKINIYKWIIPGLVILFIILLLVWLFTSNKNKDKKTEYQLNPTIK